jgi:small conductance mechanosensitive channel
MVKIVLYFIIVLIIASSLGIPMSSLIAVFSVAGIAVSLAVQGTLSNFAGGIMIMVSKPFGPGNYVEAAGVAGTIKEIGIVYTKLTTPDNKLILIPNSEISSGKIVNYSSESTRRIDNRFSASYDDSPEAVKKAILDALSSVEGILSEPAPFVNIAEYRDSSIAYAVQVWVENSNYAAVNSALLEEIKRQFDKHGIHMTYNHLNVHINKS